MIGNRYGLRYDMEPLIHLILLNNKRGACEDVVPSDKSEHAQFPDLGGHFIGYFHFIRTCIPGRNRCFGLSIFYQLDAAQKTSVSEITYGWMLCFQLLDFLLHVFTHFQGVLKKMIRFVDINHSQRGSA